MSGRCWNKWADGDLIKEDFKSLNASTVEAIADLEERLSFPEVDVLDIDSAIEHLTHPPPNVNRIAKDKIMPEWVVKRSRARRAKHRRPCIASLEGLSAHASPSRPQKVKVSELYDDCRLGSIELLSGF